MLYRNIETGQTGFTLDRVVTALPHVSIPLNSPLDPATGYDSYSETPMPTLAWDEVAEEAEPVDGVQVWIVAKLTGEGLQAARVAEVETQFATRIAAGLPYAGQVIDIDDGARADLSGMGTTAGFVIAGLVPEWPQGMATGWVARGNQHVPLPTPQEGLKLALTAAGYYSALVQHEAALISDASADPASGWPSAA